MIRIFMKIATGIAAALFFFACTSPSGSPDKQKVSQVDSTAVEQIDDNGFRFYILSDWGVNGYYNQTEVADAMVRTAMVASPKFIVSCGDNFQTNGVQSVTDPLWKVNFEEVYKHPVFNVDWYPILGNHDYKGNTQAEIDYSQISRRWRMPARYYTFAKQTDDSTSVRFIFLDTPSLLSEYWSEPQEYPDVVKQDSAKQVAWLKHVLANSPEKWKLVFGHHPLYSASTKHGSSTELIAKLKPLFDQYHVDFYICGHDHDFQHLRPQNSSVDYIVTGTGGKVRECSRDENTLFSASKPGFTLVSIDRGLMKLILLALRAM